VTHELEPTKHGGVRRTRIAQKTDNGTPTDPAGAGGVREVTEAHGQSATRIKWRRAVRIPHRVLKIKLREPLGLPECPYVVRWRIEFPFGSIRVHHWLSHDDHRAFHDHPWWFLTFVVKGGYDDFSPANPEVLKAPAIRYRPALHRHTVFPHPGGAWTVLITGRPLRKWGFWHNGKLIKANKWFLTFGHHPCE
jgi:hypothetical protein